jgi:perosamine synthetase
MSDPTEDRIHYTLPSVTELELRYVADAAAHGWGPRCYDYIQRFEADFARHLGVRHAIATSSCTGALHMGLAALGVGTGDEVILADINWIATAAPIHHLGATPVFVDVLEHSWCMDPARVAAAITPRTKAIIATHLYGNLCEMQALLELGERHGIAVVEDAAEAIGSVHHGQRAGAMGSFGSFSFHGTKTLSTGEGGMFVCNDSVLFERVLALSNHGRVAGQARQFWPEAIGFKYKMSNLQAALGCAQLERIEELVGAKRRILAAYRERLADLPLHLNPEDPGCINGCWMPTAIVDAGLGFDREALLADFKADRIDGRTFFWPLSMLPMFEPRPDNVVSYGLQGRGINLPSYHDLSEAQIDRVCAHVRRHVQGLRHG